MYAFFPRRLSLPHNEMKAIKILRSPFFYYHVEREPSEMERKNKRDRQRQLQ